MRRVHNLQLQNIKQEPQEADDKISKKVNLQNMKPETRVLLRRVTSNNLHETVESCLTARNMKALRDRLKTFESRGKLSKQYCQRSCTI